MPIKFARIGLTTVVLSACSLAPVSWLQTSALAQSPTPRPLRYYGVDYVNSLSDYDLLKTYNVNTVQVAVSESGLTQLNNIIAQAETTQMHVIIWPSGPHFCGSNCIPWDYVSGAWVVDEAVKPLLTRLKEWYQTGQGATLFLGVNAFQEPHNDNITLAQQAALAAKLHADYGIPVVDWIDNVVDTGLTTNTQWLAQGGNAIDWPITWTHCMPWYQGTGSNTCPQLTCELANPSNPACCLSQWATSCSQKCYGPEGTCGYGMDKITRDRNIVGTDANYGVLLQAFENVPYNNAHVPTAAQMYEEACRIARSGTVDLMLWYDWDKSYSGYTKTLHNGQFDPTGDDRWVMVKQIYDDCAIKPNNQPTPTAPPPIAGDRDGDGDVDILDILKLMGAFNSWKLFDYNLTFRLL